MNENQLSRAKKDIMEVLDKLEIQTINDPEEKTMLAAYVETAAADGMMMNVCLYVTIKDKNEIVTLEIEMQDEMGEDKIVQVMELVNLINRLPIVGHLFVHLRDRTVFFKKDITLVNGRLNKIELEWSINDLLANAAFYSIEIQEIAYFNETLNERAKSSWVNSSYLHKKCRSDDQE
jgi:hypothetical protein